MLKFIYSSSKKIPPRALAEVLKGWMVIKAVIRLGLSSFFVGARNIG
jgi:hypothetical protein